MTLTVGVTGGTGFIGRRIIQCLMNEGVHVISLQRSSKATCGTPVRRLDLSSMGRINEELLKGIDVIVHTAALVHAVSAEESQHKLLNSDATIQLFNLARAVGVKKFIFISTVGVYGVSSHSLPLDLKTHINPQTLYAKAKRTAEIQLLKKIYPNIAVSVFRLPLVTGENAPGNYGLLEKISKSKLPLPFGITENKRSVVSVDLVAKVIVDSAKNIQLYNGLHLLSKEPPVSTKDLIVQLRHHYAMPINLLPVPKLIMKCLLTLLGKKKMYEQLYEDLVFKSSIDTQKYH